MFYGCETWSLTLTEQAESVRERDAAEDTRRSKGQEVTGDRSVVMVCAAQQTLLGISHQRNVMGGECSRCGRQEKCIQCFGRVN